MMKTTFWYLMLLAVLASTSAGRSHRQPIVRTPRGLIYGSTLTSRLGKAVYSFRGLRYAKAPINDLRFQPPQPPEEWEGSYNATEDGPSCPQVGFKPTSEDCLFLNVHTTKLPSGSHNPQRPVIVYLHAGAFIEVTGSSKWAGPQYFLDQDIVFVTLNYRLGVLGFVSTGDKEAPGNLGMKDQVMALRWVKENIIHFGGSPNCITIFGYSAGSTSVYLHLMSPMTNGLFHRAIASSASPLGKDQLKTNNLDILKKHAKLVGCPDDTPTNILNCMRTKPVDLLAESIYGLWEFGNAPIVFYEPVVELDFGQERYLTENPIEMAVRGDFKNVPLLTGLTKDEFGYLSLFLAANKTLLDELDQNFERYAPIVFGYERDTERSRIISQKIRKAYFGDRHLDNSTVTDLAKLYEDSIIGFDVNRAAKLIAAKNSFPVYYYRFTYQGRFSHRYLPGTNNTVPYGVSHHDDLIYLFYISPVFPFFNATDPESQMVDKLTTLWANFARTGNPIPEPSAKFDNVRWDAFTQENGKYMDIGDKLVMKTRLHQERYKVWEDAIPLPNV